ncbi:MAG: hypothetical protein WCI88_09550 [Chloroflexota bacterium]
MKFIQKFKVFSCFFQNYPKQRWMGFTNLSIFTIAILILGALSPVETISRAEEAQPNPVIMLPATIEIEETITNVVQQVLTENKDIFPAVSYFAITDQNELDTRWRLLSVTGLSSNKENWNLMDDSIWAGLVVLHRTDIAQPWEGSVEGSSQFSNLIHSIPSDLLSEEAKQGMAPLSSPNMGLPASSSYQFPWTSGTTMKYGTAGIHANGFNSVTGNAWLAVDFLSGSGFGSAPNSVRAAASGTISYVCRSSGQVSSAIRVGEIFYTHLVYTSNLTVGHSYNQGDTIGALRTGSFSEICGYASGMPSDGYHIHLGFPSVPVTFDGLTLSSDGVWRNGNQERRTGSLITAGNTLPPPTDNILEFFRLKNYVRSDCGCCVTNSEGLFVTCTDSVNGLNDKALSMHIRSGWSALLYEHSDQKGGTKCLTADTPDFEAVTFNNADQANTAIKMMSSYRLYAESTCPGTVTPPSIPSLLTPANGAIFTKGQTISLSWSATGTQYYGEVWGGPAPGYVVFNWQSATSYTFYPQVTGNYTWKVKARNTAGDSGFSEYHSFTIRPLIPDPPIGSTLISPKGHLTTALPSFKWKAVSNSSNYLILLNQVTTTKYQKWYSSSQANCSGGSGQCSISAPITLPRGKYTWYIRTNNSGGNGPLSSGNIFSYGIKPEPVSLISPFSIMSLTRPTFTWNASMGASAYTFLLKTGTRVVLTLSYTDAQANCPTDTGRCFISPSIVLPRGSYVWYILARNTYGTSSWSLGKTFTIR